MFTTLRIAILGTLAASCLPMAASAQSRSTDSLLVRIERLERQTAALEERLRQLEAGSKATPTKARPGGTSGDWRILANWRRLTRGMSMDQVRGMLGEPDKVVAGALTSWSWGEPGSGGEVTFMNDKLYGWSEPERD